MQFTPIKHYYSGGYLYIYIQIEQMKNFDNSIFEQITNNNWDAIVMADLEGNVIYANKAANKLYGFDEGELVGKHVDIFNAQISHETGNIIQEIISKGGWSGEIVQKKKDNSNFTALLTVTMNYDNQGNPIGYTSNSKDVSARIEDEKKLRKALKEKQLLLDEIHHRLKNNLAIINAMLQMQSMNSDDIQLKSSLKDSQSRIKTTALVHEMLYENDSLVEIEFDKYIERLTKEIEKSYKAKDKKINVRSKLDSIKLDIQNAIPCGLILNELITNAYKHAFTAKEEGNIDIIINQTENNIVLSVEDNGTGLPPGFDLENINSTGFNIVKSLAIQLDGELSANGLEGSIIKLSFNLDQNE